MNEDTAKDALEQAAAVTGAALVSSAVGAAAVPAVVVAAVHAWYALQARQVRAWWDYTIRGDDSPSDLQANIDLAVAKNDQRRIEGILRGARAAAEVVDPVVIAAIGTLSRRYLGPGSTLAPWLFRAQLGLLSAMSGAEYSAMQQLIRDVSSFAKGRSDLTKDGRIRLSADKGASGLVFGVRRGERHEICSTTGARRLFRLLKAHDLGDTLAEPPADVASVDSLGMELDVLADLAATLLA